MSKPKDYGTSVVAEFRKCPVCCATSEVPTGFYSFSYCSGTFQKPHRRVKTFVRAHVLSGGMIEKIRVGAP